MAQNSKDAQKRTSRAERRAAEAAAMKARAEQMEKERKQQTIIGGIVVAVLVILVAIGAFTVYHNMHKKAETKASTETVQEAYTALQKVKNTPKLVDKKGGLLISKNGYGKVLKDAATAEIYTANGRNEYTSLRKTVVAGSRIKMPTGNSNGNYKFAGWATKVGGSVSKKKGATVKVKSNLKFYVVQQKVSTSGVKLYKYDGTYWKTVSNTNGKATFPAVSLGTGNMVLGWSKTQGKNTLSSSDYKAGDRIPTKNGKYYMVIFGMSMDRAPSVITKATKFDKVYCVGDSRTADTKMALGVAVPSNVEFIAKWGEGLYWFKSTGYRQLLSSVSKQPKNSKKAVIINLGVNDLNNGRAYVTYMKKVAANLKKYNCKMYYLSVNPVNSAMIKSVGGKARSEAQIASFNRTIYKNLCSGKNKSFTYINSCTNLQMKGWISNRHDMGIYDGLHYSNATYLRIFDYCMRYLNR